MAIKSLIARFRQDCNKQQELAPEMKEQQKSKAFDTRLFKNIIYTNRINGV
jgi:hypothetical protein